MHDCSTVPAAGAARAVRGVCLLLAAVAAGACLGAGKQNTLPALTPEGFLAMNTAVQPPGGELPADARIRLNPSNGTIESLKGENLSAFLERDAQFLGQVRSGLWGEASVSFLKALGTRVRLNDPALELSVESVVSDDLGFRHVRLGQRYRGLPVWEAGIIVHWNSRGAIYLVNGDYVPTPSAMSVRPGLDPAAALQKAEVAVAVPCRDCLPELGVFGHAGDRARLAYRLMIPDGIARVWKITLDAHDGEVLQKLLVPR